MWGVFSCDNWGMRLSDVSAVKVLGRAIGGVSDVDGDGDGFVSGPDGRDNVPAPAVAAAEAISGVVADVIRPTDDLFEVRKSGRPWRPMLFGALSDEEKREWGDLMADVANHQVAQGRKARKFLKDLDEKHGGGYLQDWGFDWNKFRADNPDMAQVDKDFLYEHVSGHTDAHREFVKRANDFDDRVRKRMLDAFEAERDKAYKDKRGAAFDKNFGKFGKSLERERGFASRILSGPGGGLGFQSWWWGFRDDGKSDLNVRNPFKEISKDDLKALAGAKNRRIGVAMHPEAFESFLNDGRMKGFFEAKRNIFIDANIANDPIAYKERNKRYLEGRLDGEQSIFGIPAGVGVKGKDRPIYGLFMPEGVRASKAASTENYGGIVVVMKRDVEERSTFTVQDSLNGGFWGASPVNDPQVESLVDQYGRFRKSAKDIDGNFDRSYGWGDGYAEAQIFGGVSTGDVSYVAVTEGDKLSESITNRLEELGIPVVYHKETKPFDEPDDLRVKADNSNAPDSYVLFATDGKRRLFVPKKPANDDDMHGLLSVGSGERKRIGNVAAFIKFGNWVIA